MAHYVIEPDNGPDIRFEGEILGHADSYDDSRNQWSDFMLYRTKGGQLVGTKSRFVRGQRDPIKLAARVLTTDAEVIEFFGDRWLAKELYDDAGISYSVKID